MFSVGVVYSLAMIFKTDTVCSIWCLKVVPFCNVKYTKGFFSVKYTKRVRGFFSLKYSIDSE